MTTSTNSESKKPRPAFRLCFSTRQGTDRNGQAILGYPVEIGAVFPRKEADKGFVAKFHIHPANFADGVLFLMPPNETAETEGAAQ